MSDHHSADSLEMGIKRYHSGDAVNALKMITLAVQADPNSARAWFWLGRVISDKDKKKYCLDRANSLDPAIEQKESNFEKAKEEPADRGVVFPPLRPNDQPVTAPVINQNVENIKPSYPFTEFDESPHKGSNLEQQKPLSKPKPALPKKTETKNSQSKLIFFLAGLLISLVVFGITITYFINNGLLDDYLSVPMSMIAGEPTPTVTYGPTPTPFRLPPTFTPTIEPTPTVTPTLDYAARLNSVAADIQLADDMLDTGDYAEAKLLMDKAIEIMPDNPKAYYIRGIAYQDMIDSLHYRSEYIDYLMRAVDDFNHAIALNPNIADYYLFRAYGLWNIANALDIQKDREPLFTVALENILMANSMGSAIDRILLNTGDLYGYNGRCQDGINVLNEVLSKYPDADFVYEAHAALARNYMCLSNYEKALEEVNLAIALNDCNCKYEYSNSLILYSLNRKEEALNILNESINSKPGYGGTRYYMRALILFDQGQSDLARIDIEEGAANTWGRSAIYYYLLSKFALEDGDLELAKEYMQSADAAYFLNESPLVIAMIKNGMSELGVESISSTSEPVLQTTPFPPDFLSQWVPSNDQRTLVTEQAAGLGAQTERWPGRYYEAITADFNTGLPASTFAPNDYQIYHLIPNEPISVARTISLQFYMLPETEYPSPIQLFLWTKAGEWTETYAVYGGDNPIDYPEMYIGKNGDLFIALRNYSNSTDIASFEVAGFIATVELTDGSTYTYGLTASPMVLEWQSQ